MSESPSNRNLNIEGNVERSVIIVGDGNSSDPLKGAIPLSERSEPLPKKLTPLERLELIQTLNALPVAQFETIVFALNPPSENMPGNSAPQGSRSQSLLAWLESPIGSGLSELKTVLESILSTRQQSAKQSERASQNHELLQTLTQALKTSAAPKYDLRGATFGGGFVETVEGDQQVINHPPNADYDEDLC